MINDFYYCQHTLQAIWALGLMEKLVCIWKIWQIREITLILSQNACSAGTLAVSLQRKKTKQKKEDNSFGKRRVK